MYQHPSQEIAEYLLAQGLVQSGQVFVDHAPIIENLNVDFYTVVRLVAGVPNPRWARDNITVAIQVMGANQSQLITCRDQIWNIYNHLLGADNIEQDGYTYFQFTSQEIPNFVGYLENAKPLYTSSISFVREAQTKEGNRDVIL